MAQTDRQTYAGELMQIGNEGESVVQDFFAYVLRGVQLDDVRRDPAWQEKDVDFRAHFSTGVLNIEVKSDRWIDRSENVLFELCRIHHTAQPKYCAYLGWSVFSAADRVLVWCAPSSRLFVFEADQMRAGMQRYTQKARKDMNLAIVDTDEQRTTINILVPLDFIRHKSYRRTNGIWTLDKERIAS